MENDPPTLHDMMRQAQEMQQRLVVAQRELAELELTGTAGGGLVKVTMRGDGEVIGLVIDQTAVDDGDAVALSTLTLTAIRRAIDAVKAATMERMSAVAG